MRLSKEQINTIRQLVKDEAGDSTRIWVFGSRLSDDARGGDLDLLVAVDEPVLNPAWLTARLEAQISRIMAGRSVDIVLEAPNLRHEAIHRLAKEEGVPL